MRNVAAAQPGARAGAVFDKLGRPPDCDDNRRVLAVIAFLRAPA